MCTHMYLHTHTHMHAYTHTHTHTCTSCQIASEHHKSRIPRNLVVTEGFARVMYIPFWRGEFCLCTILTVDAWMKALSTSVLLCMLCLLSGTPPFSFLPWQLFPLHFFLIQTWSDVINGDSDFMCDLVNALSPDMTFVVYWAWDVKLLSIWEGMSLLGMICLGGVAALSIPTYYTFWLLCLAGRQTVLPHSCSALWWSWRQRVRTTWPTSIASSPPSWRSCTRWHESTSSPPARRPLQVSVLLFVFFVFMKWRSVSSCFWLLMYRAHNMAVLITHVQLWPVNSWCFLIFFYVAVIAALLTVVVVMVAFSLHARILGECSTIHSTPAFFFFF